jgi:hypothetical protein
MRFASSCFAALLIVLAACQSPTDSKSRREIGVIDYGGTLNSVIQAPSAVRIGQSFTATISTFGNSCVSAAGADVATDGLTATITPYDIVSWQHTCLDYLAPYPRTVQLRFDQAGTATIRVNGRSYYTPGRISVEHTLIVSQ